MRSYSTAPMAAAAALLLLLVSLTAAAAAADMSIISYGERIEEQKTRRMFVEWRARHGKTYHSVGEEEHRYAVFKGTLRFVEQHNAAAAAGFYSYTVGINYFADLTTEEISAICCGLLDEEDNMVHETGATILTGSSSTS